MNKKSFFWPVLSDEERAQASRAKAKRALPDAQHEQMQELQAMPAQETNYEADEETSGFVELTSDLPVMPSASGYDDGSAEWRDVGAAAGQPSQTSYASYAGASSSSAGGDAFGSDAFDADNLLVLDNVKQSYAQAEEDLVVLNGANLTVRAGEMVALVAPSGAGKSTLLHIAGLLERPTSGEVYIASVAQGEAADRSRTLVRRNEIGFVYQFHHLLAEFSALENVMLPQLISGQSRKEAEIRAAELLAYMKIDHRADHRPSELSGGEKQRVAIARAMANAPRVLLADEPTGNLDPNTSEYVFKALNALVKQSGIAALVATHNLFLAERMDRQITLVDGKIVDL